MRRGFLLVKTTAAPSSSIECPVEAPASLPLKLSARDDLTRVVSAYPRIVCSDIRLPPDQAPHFMYLPPGKDDMVFVDYLENLLEMARWPIWARAAQPPPPVPDPPFEIRSVPGKGVGMVAARAIKAGELIAAERPVYAQRADLPRAADFNFFNGRAYVAPVAGLAPAAQVKIMSLSNAFMPGERHPLAGIFHTNNLELDVTPEPDPSARFVGCFPTLARSNHACSPSANYYFDFGAFRGELRAVHALAPGDEITIGYCDLLAPRAERRAALQRLFRFTCACAACALPDAQARESDARRARLRALLARIEQPNAAVTLEQLRDGVHAARSEGLAARVAQVLFYGCGCLLYRMDFENGLRWAREAKTENAIVEGEGSATMKVLSCMIPN